MHAWCPLLAVLRAVVWRSRRLVMPVAVGSLCFAFAGCDYLPRQEKVPAPAKPKDTFERKRVCMEVGERVDQKERKGDSAGGLLLEPTYCYNDSLNTCLYAGEFVSVKDSYRARWVRDCLTNRVLVECTLMKGAVVSGVSPAEFENAKAHLMAEGVR